MKVAVIQSNYIPWKGYFDIIHDADVFVFHDDLQYTKNDWRNRNKIKTPNGLKWLSIPVGSSEARLICEVRLPNDGWAKEHWRKLEASYGKAPFFKTYEPFFQELYFGRQWETLSAFNQCLIRSIASELLGIETEFHDSREYALKTARLDRLLELLEKIGAEEYISGPSAATYIEPERFAQANIKLTYKDYSNYPEYPQLYPPFEHAVSIVDLLFQVGPEAPHYIWGWRGVSP
jgi:hypothetical protein